MSKKRSLNSLLGTAANILVIVLAIGLIASPNGPLGGQIQRWKAGLTEGKAIDQNWDALTIGAMGVGPETAPSKIVEFFDYQCPYCRQMQDLKKRSAVDDQAQFLFRHLPLRSIHPNAELAARISLCFETDPDRWPQVHDWLYEAVDTLDGIDWAQELEDKGFADGSDLNECVSSRRVSDRLAEDEAFAAALGITGTPAYVFPDGILRGVQSESILAEEIRAR